MEPVLGGLVRNSCMVYLDGILVIGKSLSEHLQNLWQVFNRLREAGLRLKPLSHETQGGIPRLHRDYRWNQVTAIHDFAVPDDLKTL